jgi:hypothetical protein
VDVSPPTRQTRTGSSDFKVMTTGLVHCSTKETRQPRQPKLEQLERTIRRTLPRGTTHITVHAFAQQLPKPAGFTLLARGETRSDAANWLESNFAANAQARCRSILYKQCFHTTTTTTTTTRRPLSGLKHREQGLSSASRDQTLAGLAFTPSMHIDFIYRAG